MNQPPETVLTRIVKDKKIWVEQRKRQQPLVLFQQALTASDRDFYHALKQPKTVFILECKKASPSKGLIREHFDLQAIATVYKDYANVISVLTDEKYFQGDFEYLPLVRQHAHQPILCKDFIIDEYQIYLARHYQADAILLMLSVLDDQQYRQLSHIAHQLNMGVLTEVSTEEELTRALLLKAKVIGINNRNLRDLSITLERTKQFAPKIPDDRIIISESGIYTHQQIRQLSQYADGFLIGSALMSAENLTLAVRRILLGENKICGLTRTEDAIVAYQAGAIYGGLIFVKQSPRYISADKAKQLTAAAALLWVGVFKNEEIDTLVHLATRLSLTAVQLHGDEDKTYIEQLRQKLPNNCQIWQAISISDQYPVHDNPIIQRYVFDNAQGGSGKTFDWQLIKWGSPEEHLDNVLLAGGINPDNALEAITFGCAGLDINSGVEKMPGIKDTEKINLLFSLLRNY